MSFGYQILGFGSGGIAPYDVEYLAIGGGAAGAASGNGGLLYGGAGGGGRGTRLGPSNPLPAQAGTANTGGGGGASTGPGGSGGSGLVIIKYKFQ